MYFGMDQNTFALALFIVGGLIGVAFAIARAYMAGQFDRSNDK